MHDCLIIGAGAIGLSLAWELASSGQRVHVIDRGQPGREASWAGAGIIPAAVQLPDQHPYEQLRGTACRLQPIWAADLKATTGIDNGYRRCGALHMARMAGDAASLTAWAANEREQGIAVNRLTPTDMSNLEPGLAIDGARALYHIPDEAQLRNPRHLTALLEACRGAGVTVTPDVTITDLITHSGQLTEVSTTGGPVRAEQYCFAAGSWTGQLLATVGIAIPIVPIRGQMVLFRCERPPIQLIVNEGSRYLVPRDDGRILVGSTEEEAGFDKRTTPAAINDLIEFARGLVPSLADAPIEKTWAGLRPCAMDGLPYMGRLPGLHNAFIAAGHFRSGLYLSAATAVVMSQLMRGAVPEIDLSPFGVNR